MRVYWTFNSNLSTPLNTEILLITFYLQIPGAPEDECVRIFVEFERMESAIKGID